MKFGPGTNKKLVSSVVSEDDDIGAGDDVTMQLR
jgi:hypothetical protein